MAVRQRNRRAPDAVRGAAAAHGVENPEPPDIGDLARTLRFNPNEGRLWFDDQRALVVRAALFGTLRHELITLLSAERTRGLLIRTGYAEGTRDAELARRLRPGGDYFETFVVGPQIHALSGFARVETRVVRADPETGFFFGDFVVHDSAEAELHLQHIGLSPEPVCWMSMGYASGYISAFIGRPVLVQESECRAMGHRACRFIGRPVEEWESRRHKAPRYFRPETFVNRFSATPDPEPQRAGNVDVVGISAGFSTAVHLLRKAAPTRVTVLCLGETGVGKEMFARMLHQMSTRAEKPFVAVNCAALPESLLEAELFGVVRGAYTGATASRPGRFERADGGTLFLDEIGTLNLASQGKLLRALQEGEIERVGDTSTRMVDVRVVAATHVDLKAEVKAGRFREDLYFRLTTFPVHIPPLRERRDDIPLLMRHFLRRFCASHGKQVPGFTARAIETLLGYGFPGNIRELENMVERAVVLVPDGEPVDITHLFLPSEQPGIATYVMGRGGVLADTQTASDPPDGDGARELIAHALAPLRGQVSMEAVHDALLAITLEECAGNRAEAARRLGLTRRQVDYRLKKRAAGDAGTQRAGQAATGS